jgi:hypothetical protein
MARPLPTDIPSVAGADEPDESRIGLTPIAAKYGGASSPPCSIPARRVFFDGQALHRPQTKLHPIATVVRSPPPPCPLPILLGRRPLAGGHVANARHILARASTTPAAARPKVVRRDYVVVQGTPG